MPRKQIHQLQTLLEIVCVFAVFAVFGGFPIPDSNEPYYISKAINFWNPGYLPDDAFLQSKDSHWAFYAAFGWLSFFLSPHGTAVAGRCITWLMLAYSWRRLSFALVPVRWSAIFTAAALAYYVDSFNMAGEWLVGGIEGKSFAFPFAFLGLEAMVRGKWNRVWLFLGTASAFHVLVGGWSVIAAMCVLLVTNRQKLSAVSYRSFCPLFIGGFISLFGLIPALLLDYGAPRDIVAQAHQIYVFERLYHHLDPAQLPWIFITRFLLLAMLWMVLCRRKPAAEPAGRNGDNQRWKRFELFIWGTLLLSFIGLAVSFGLRWDKPLAAEILRFYWFRLADITVPMGVALGAMRRLADDGKWIKNDGFNSLLSVRRSSLLFLPFFIYLLADYLLFGRFFFSWTVPADQGIPWCIAVLFCGMMLYLLSKLKNGSLPLIPYQFLLCAVILFYAPFSSFKNYADQRTRFAFSRSESGNPSVAYYWQDVCRWIADPAHTPETAKFLVPRDASTFRWFANRSNIGIWKDIPQDAAGIVAWYEKMHDLYFYRNEDGKWCGDRSLTILLWWKTPEELEGLRKKYGFDYIVCAAYPELPQHPDWQPVYKNELFVVYRCRR
ncbi:MAG: hypothetical protein LBN39_10880 [Planctomycetaceae bacterium]|jgi:hypothetical protein|nr:hypothetical protein [Planctomycetaceae bacterium]